MTALPQNTQAHTALPLTIISGYLGAGKTTLVNHILRHADGRSIVVLVNDFGTLPIDADLIESRDGDTLNLANGCACCSMGGDLFNALVDVLDRKPQPDNLLIEASGIADPARIANIALAEPDLQLDATVSLIDTENFDEQVNDPMIGETIKSQLAASDIVLLNKIDLFSRNSGKALHEKFANLAPNARLIKTEFGRVPVDLVLGINLADKREVEKAAVHHDHGDIYAKWSITLDQPLDRGKLSGALDAMGSDVLRLKGFVHLDDSEDTHIVQYVGRRWSITSSSTTHVPGRTSLVAIGLKDRLDLDRLNKLFIETTA